MWRRKCSGYARQRPKLMNCCRPEQIGTKEFGKMLKRIQTLEEGSVPAKETQNWRIEGGDVEWSSSQRKVMRAVENY